MTRASVLIPAHDKPTTLPLTVDTVLRQSVTDLEVIVIGDGVTDAVRDAVSGLVDADERVRFLDFPKGPHHGERYRHDAVRAAHSDAIFYVCDDDLLLPDHVADLLALLEDHNLVQSFNGYCRPDGSIGFYPGDLSHPRTTERVLRSRYNVVSITGTAHRRDFYDLVDDPWDTTPAGEWPDHHQWRKLIGHPEFRGATSERMTALQFPTSGDGRDTWSAEERERELRTWHGLVTGPDAQARIDEMVRRHALATLATLWDERLELWDTRTNLRARVAELAAELRAERATVRRASRELDLARRRLALKNKRLHRLRKR